MTDLAQPSSNTGVHERHPTVVVKESCVKRCSKLALAVTSAASEMQADPIRQDAVSCSERSILGFCQVKTSTLPNGVYESGTPEEVAKVFIDFELPVERARHKGAIVLSAEQIDTLRNNS